MRLQFGNRYSRYQGVRQSILGSADCLVPTSGEASSGADEGESYLFNG